MKEYRCLQIFGDSHVIFLHGLNSIFYYPSYKFHKLNWVKPHYIKSFIAYNLLDKYDFIKDIMVKELTENDLIGFCFGEIDCRNHLPYRIERDSSYKDISNSEEIMLSYIRECVSGYLNFVKRIKLEFNKDILLVEPFPTTDHFPDKGTFHGEHIHTCGNMILRNKITRLFGKILNELSKEISDVYTISLFNELILSDYKTDFTKYQDNIHLNSNCTDLFKKKINELGIQFNNT